MERNTTEVLRSTRVGFARRHLLSRALLVMVSVGASGCIVVPLGYWGHGGHQRERHRDWALELN
jgi:hypothetical protein